MARQRVQVSRSRNRNSICSCLVARVVVDRVMVAPLRSGSLSLIQTSPTRDGRNPPRRVVLVVAMQTDPEQASCLVRHGLDEEPASIPGRARQQRQTRPLPRTEEERPHTGGLRARVDRLADEEQAMTRSRADQPATTTHSTAVEQLDRVRLARRSRAVAGWDPRHRAAAGAGWRRGDVGGLHLPLKPDEDQRALTRPAMTLARAELRERLARLVARARRRWLHPSSVVRPATGSCSCPSAAPCGSLCCADGRGASVHGDRPPRPAAQRNGHRGRTSGDPATAGTATVQATGPDRHWTAAGRRHVLPDTMAGPDTAAATSADPRAAERAASGDCGRRARRTPPGGHPQRQRWMHHRHRRPGVTGRPDTSPATSRGGNVPETRRAT